MTTQKPKTLDTPTPPEAASGVTLTALTPIEHDGKPYAVGDRLTVTEAQAALLIGVKAATPLAASAPVAE